VYFETADSSNGYDTVSHVAIYTGLVENVHTFADFARGMSDGPMDDRSLREIVDSMYFRRSTQKWNFSALNGVDQLSVHIFDVIGMREQLGLIETLNTEVFNPVWMHVSEGTIPGMDATWQEGGVVIPNSSRIFESGIDIAITVNLNDGTTALFEVAGTTVTQIPWEIETQRMELYAVLGRGLKVNRKLSESYAATEWAADGSRYDGENGVYFYANGVPRTTYTPPFIGRVNGFGTVENFGLIGGRTNIGFVNAILDDGANALVYAGLHSHYTIHAVPEATADQQVLLREPDLARANDMGNPEFGPLPWPTVNRSSGCINYNYDIWYYVLTPRIDAFLAQNKQVVVIFSYPGLSQDLIIRTSHFMVDDPLSNRNVDEWGYGEIHDSRLTAPGQV